MLLESILAQSFLRHRSYHQEIFLTNSRTFFFFQAGFQVIAEQFHVVYRYYILNLELCFGNQDNSCMIWFQLKYSFFPLYCQITMQSQALLRAHIHQAGAQRSIRPCSLAPDGLKYILPYEKYEVPSCFGLKRGAFSLPKTSFALIPFCSALCTR